MPELGPAALARYLGTLAGASVEVLALPPFLAFRALVIAHPVWYPERSSPSRGA